MSQSVIIYMLFFTSPKTSQNTYIYRLWCSDFCFVKKHEGSVFRLSDDVERPNRSIAAPAATHPDEPEPEEQDWLPARPLTDTRDHRGPPNIPFGVPPSL